MHISITLRMLLKAPNIIFISMRRNQSKDTRSHFKKIQLPNTTTVHLKRLNLEKVPLDKIHEFMNSEEDVLDDVIRIRRESNHPVSKQRLRSKRFIASLCFVML